MSAFQADQQLILALSKGRIFEDTLPLLEAAGITVTENPETSRKLILPTNDPNVRVLIVRATDVPTYVQHGAADFGVAPWYGLPAFIARYALPREWMKDSFAVVPLPVDGALHRR